MLNSAEGCSRRERILRAVFVIFVLFRGRCLCWFFMSIFILSIKAWIVDPFVVHAGKKINKMSFDLSQILKSKFTIVQLTVYNAVIDDPVNED